LYFTPGTKFLGHHYSKFFINPSISSSFSMKSFLFSHLVLSCFGNLAVEAQQTPTSVICDSWCSVVNCALPGIPLSGNPLCIGCDFCENPKRCDSMCSQLITPYMAYNCGTCDWSGEAFCPITCNRMMCDNPESGCSSCKMCINQYPICDTYCTARHESPQCTGCPRHPKNIPPNGFCDTYCTKVLINFGKDGPNSRYRPCGSCTTAPDIASFEFLHSNYPHVHNKDVHPSHVSG